MSTMLENGICFLAFCHGRQGETDIGCVEGDVPWRKVD